MRKLTILTLTAVSAAVFTSCSKMGALSPENFTVTPTPLEAVGGEVQASISATFPKKYMKKKATVVATPVLKYNGGELVGEGAVYQGEKVAGNATTVNYKVGGTYTMNALEAAELVNEMRPRVAIPVHYGSVVGKESDGEEFARYVEPPVKVEIKISFDR